MAYQIHLPIFEGPFDLLFHLIKQQKIDLKEIPIAEITEQYLNYLTALEEIDLDMAGEFLVMAATLLSIKVRMLLPEPAAADETEEEPVDPQQLLIARLLEYNRYKEAAAELDRLSRGREKLFPRGAVIPLSSLGCRYTRPVGDLTVRDLKAAMESLSAVAEPPDLTPIIPEVRVTVRERLEELHHLLKNQVRLAFQSLPPSLLQRSEIVVTFLAMLELIRLGLCLVKQEEPFGLIELMPAPAGGWETGSLETEAWEKGEPSGAGA